jgi:hypothetical protein
MPYPQFDRSRLVIKPLTERANKLSIETDHVSPEQAPRALGAAERKAMDEVVTRIKTARRANRSVVMAFGAHTIKNGLGPVLIRLMEQGWVTHLATNGAGIIHDWEFAFQGASSEDVKGNVARGEFGIWQETGFNINLAVVVGAYEGLGYGESVGKMIEREGLEIPTEDGLKRIVSSEQWTVNSGEGRAEVGNQRSEIPSPQPSPLEGEGVIDRVAAAADLLGVIRRFDLKPGWRAIPHPFKGYSAQAAAFRLKIPFTGHPMFGHDIIYNHPMNHGAAIGRTALRDFLAFTQSISQLQDGVYLSVGSAVMSPMIFEKALSMAQNIEIQSGRRIDRHFIAVVDLAESRWNWQRDGEPPMDNPAYYLRYCKTFSRMGGEMRYLCADNRDFLLSLCQGLGGKR